MLKQNLFAIALLTSFISVSGAATLVVNGSGQLTGATDVNVSGTSYDVNFYEGTFSDVFGSASGLDAINSTEAEAFSVALLAQVFVDGPQGSFDSNPMNTYGCIYDNLCWVFTPYNVVSDTINVYMATNDEQEAPVRTTGSGDTTREWTTTTVFDSAHTGPTGSKVLWADWSVSAEVPIPAAAWLFGSALIGLVGIKRKK